MGIKRLLLTFLLTAVPMVSAQPISVVQDATLTLTQLPAGIDTARHFGVASWYSESDPGIRRHTASGEVFEDSRLTCASWHYPFGTYLEVINVVNGRSVLCRVNDRGPARRLHRLIDLTKATFRQIASLGSGLIDVSVTPVAYQKRRVTSR